MRLILFAILLIATEVSAQKTNFFFGRTGGMDGIQLDAATDSVALLPSVSFQGQGVGWMAYEPTSRTVLASDIGTGLKLQLYTYAPATAQFTPKTSFSIAARSVHLTLANNFDLFSSAYFDGKLYRYKMDQAMTQLRLNKTVNFGTTAKVHSTAFDSVRGLLYVATLGLDSISVYKVTATALTSVGSISIVRPRTLLYDPIFDKLYVATEANTGGGFIQGFSTTVSGSTYTFKTIAKQTIPMLGADLKINHVFRYIMATAREVGKESVWAMPLTGTGGRDNSRLPFSFPIGLKQPRSLELTEDGRYAVVAMNSNLADNVQVYKLNFDANLKFVSSENIFSQKLSAYGYNCSIRLPGSL